MLNTDFQRRRGWPWLARLAALALAASLVVACAAPGAETTTSPTAAAS